MSQRDIVNPVMSDREWQAGRPDRHTEIIDPRQHPLAAYPIASWVEASQWRPVPDRPILIWRASFTPDDFPVYGRYCSCHGRYIYDSGAWTKNDITGEIEPVVVEPDDVTYWRDAYSGPNIGG